MDRGHLISPLLSLSLSLSLSPFYQITIIIRRRRRRRSCTNFLYVIIYLFMSGQIFSSKEINNRIIIVPKQEGLFLFYILPNTVLITTPCGEICFPFRNFLTFASCEWFHLWGFAIWFIGCFPIWYFANWCAIFAQFSFFSRCSGYFLLIIAICRY